MDKLLDEIESYWSTRTEGYSEVNEKELKGMQKKAWLETLERGFFGKRSGKNEDSENNSVEKEVFEEEFSEKQHTDKYKDHLRILDIGTGPGFFPMILAEAGYHVTAIDYTPGMLEKAAENAAQTIKKAEDRQEFKDTMEKIGEPVAASKVVTTVEDGLAFTNTIGYPVVLRPAYTHLAEAAAELHTMNTSFVRSWRMVFVFPVLERFW